MRRSPAPCPPDSPWQAQADHPVILGRRQRKEEEDDKEEEEDAFAPSW
jgi:hypothetical protein